MKVIVAGSRGFSDFGLMCKTLDENVASDTQAMKITTIISGGARGADKLGGRYAHERGIPVERFPAQWETYGARAGCIRNMEMAGCADMLVAFWDGFSSGTKHMITVAEAKGLQVQVVRF